ncbi:deaminase [Candidatus Corynebacterium faecigallinarum]|uniref:deaminase n=1 Tax=Candidatus Corynebacterium faecigallinarum TaxID=2838528 RepID=UPI003FD14C53
MVEAVNACIAHVENGGLPFVGVLADDRGQRISGFGVNRVAETGDPTAHAEIVAMREAEYPHGARILDGATLLATGEPCGLCYRYAVAHGVSRVFVTIDRDTVAQHGFDYRGSYQHFGVTDCQRITLFHPLPVDRGIDPFTLFLKGHHS